MQARHLLVLAFSARLLSLGTGCFVEPPECSSGSYDGDGACVEEEPVVDDDTGSADDTGDVVPLATCQQVQWGEVSGTVTLEGVVATSDSAAWSYGFFVQDIGGGEWSGLFVYLDGVSVDVERGDQLTITGEISEYYDLTEVTVTSPSALQVTGTRHPVETTLTQSQSDWEPWEAVLVELDGLQLTSDPDEYGEAETSFGLPLDDMLFAWHDHVGEQRQFGAVLGVLNYSYEAFKLEPRDVHDFVD